MHYAIRHKPTGKYLPRALNGRLRSLDRADVWTDFGAVNTRIYKQPGPSSVWEIVVLAVSPDVLATPAGGRSECAA